MSGSAIIQAQGRRRAMLRTAMGPAIAAALSDTQVIEIMVNPDGVLRLDSLGEGRVDTGNRLEAAAAESTIRLDRKSVGEGKSLSVRVDMGGRRIIKKKKSKYK